MSRALQIKQAGELLGTKFEVTDADIEAAFEDIISKLEVKNKNPKNSLVIGFLEKVKDDDFNVHLEYDRVNNVLIYTRYFIQLVRLEGFKIRSNKFHAILIKLINKKLNVRIGIVRPFHRHLKFPVC